MERASKRSTAFDVGYSDGRANRQNQSKEYMHADNMKAWFEGWKKGQADYARELQGDKIPPAPRLSVLTAQKVKSKSRKSVKFEHDHDKRREQYLKETGRL